MLSVVSPIPSSHFKEWFYDHVVSIHLEGVARVQRAWSGLNKHTIERPYPRLSLKERAISLITGLILCLPLFNIIVWRGLEAFGKVVILAPPYIPNRPLEEAAPEQPAFSPILEVEEQVSAPEAVAAIQEPPPPLSSRDFQYTEETNGTTLVSDWKVETFNNRVEYTRKAPPENPTQPEVRSLSKAICDLNGQMVDFDYVSGNKEDHFHARMNGREIKAIGKKGKVVKEKDYVLPGHYPWIQQPTLGFKNFILSSEQKLDFLGINPKDFSLVHVVATKKNEEEVPGFGKLLRMELRLTGLLSWFWKAELWFDAATGEMKQMRSNSGPGTHLTLTRLVQSNP